MTARLIGLAQPPRPLSLAGWSSRSLHRVVHGSRAPSSHALVLAFGMCPPQSSPHSGTIVLAVDRTSEIPKDLVAGHAFVGSSMIEAGLVNESDHRHGVIARRPPSSPLARSVSGALRPGPLRRFPIRAHAAVSCDFAAARRPTGVASPDSSRVANLPTVFQAGSSMGAPPSEVSPRSPPPDPLGSSCPPCRFPPCDVAAPRI